MVIGIKVISIPWNLISHDDAFSKQYQRNKTVVFCGMAGTPTYFSSEVFGLCLIQQKFPHSGQLIKKLIIIIS